MVLLSSVFIIQTQQASAEGNVDYIKGEVLVKFVEGTNQNDIANTHRKNGGEVKEVIPAIDVQVIDIGIKNVGQAVAAYAKSGHVDFVEPNYIAKALTTDPYYDRQWGLNNTGQLTCNTAGDICTTGSDDADVDAPEGFHERQRTVVKYKKCLEESSGCAEAFAGPSPKPCTTHFASRAGKSQYRTLRMLNRWA